MSYTKVCNEVKMKKSKGQQNDIYAGLYFKILYVQVRKFKEEIISLLGILGEMYEEAIVGHTYKSLEIDDILRAKLKKISEKFKEINDNLIDSSTVIDEVLDLYEGFGVDEVYQADTGNYFQQKSS